MSIPREHLSTLRALGYTETEARFLYLVATHSGYFTQRHYLAFAQQSKGHRVHRLTTRASTAATHGSAFSLATPTSTISTRGAFTT